MKAGQKIYIIERGNIREYEVLSVGRKYFYTSYGRFNIKTRYEITSYGSSNYAYSSLQEIEDEKERNRINSMISDKFKYGNSRLSLNSLRKIKQIIESEDKT